MENPKCPYCGDEQYLTIEDHSELGRMVYYLCIHCGSRSPAKTTIEEAFAAAMKRERPKGEWIDFGDELDKSAGRHSYQCSRCFTDASYFISGFEWDEWTAPHFCPNCGAEMREEAHPERSE